MTVLIGEEGIGKSLGLKSLFPKEWRLRWFSDSIHLRVSDRELLEKVAGFVLLEIGELSGMMRVEQERVKTLISSCQDVARLPIGRTPRLFPGFFTFAVQQTMRAVGFCPTRQKTGGSGRCTFRPTVTGTGYCRWFEANYEQFWAQALVEWKAAGIEAWINPEELEPERLDAAGSPDLVDAMRIWTQRCWPKAALSRNCCGRWVRSATVAIDPNPSSWLRSRQK